MIDKEDILKKLTSEDIIGIVEKYGGDKCSEDDEKIIFTTICHNSNSHKLYYYKNSDFCKSDHTKDTYYCYNCDIISCPKRKDNHIR